MSWVFAPTLEAANAQSSGLTGGLSASCSVTAALTTFPVGAEFVSAKTGTDTVTLDSWVETGDLAIIMAFRDGSATPPSVPTFTYSATQQAMPVTASWISVTYGNGTFVAVAQNTSIAATSPDGVSWTQQAMPVTAAWRSVTYANGVFVAVAQSSSIAATSPDGVTWTQQALPTSASWYSVAYGNGVFVAVAFASSIAATSPDGVTWTQQALPVSASWYSVAYGNGVFVAVAGASSIAATSPDGVTWTQQAMPVSTTWYSVTYANGVFVVVTYGTSTIAATSPDGVTWTQQALPVSASWWSVTYGNGVFVAIANSTTVAATSPDGVTWTQQAMPTSGGWFSVTYGNGVFVAVAFASSIAATIPLNIITTHDSSAGTAVSSVLASKVLIAGGVQSIGPFTNATSVACSVYRNVNPVAPIGNVAVNSGTGTVVTLPAVTTVVDDFAVCFAGHQSTDVMWPTGIADGTSAITIPDYPQDVAYDGVGTYALVADGGWQGYSNSGLSSFTVGTKSGDLNGLSYSVAWGASKFVLAMSSARLGYSSDGTAWTAGSSGFAGNGIFDIAFANSVFVIVGQFGYIGTSATGTTFSSASRLGTGLLRGVAYGGTTWVAGGSGGVVGYSTTLPTFTSVTSQFSTDSIMAVAYGNGLFVAVGDYGKISTSPDGIVWTARTPVSTHLVGVAYGSGMWLALSSTGQLIQSTNGTDWSEYATLSISSPKRLRYVNGYFVVTATGALLYFVDLGTGAVLRRAQNIDATDAIVVYDSAGPVP